jgi:hypothetical protein
MKAKSAVEYAIAWKRQLRVFVISLVRWFHWLGGMTSIYSERVILGRDLTSL